MNSICYIVGSASVDDICIEEGFIIAADGGYSTVKKHGKTPDIIIGDFDSLGFVPKEENVLCFPVQKDDTDTFLAVKKGIRLKKDNFVIYGGTGGRGDHTFANIQTLSYCAAHGKKAFLIGKGSIYTVIKDSEITFDNSQKGKISVFSLSDIAENVNISGLKYTLNGQTVTRDYPIGVSNEFIGQKARISVEKGELLIIWNQDCKDFINKLNK